MCFAQTIGDLSGAGEVLLPGRNLTESTGNSITFSGSIVGASGGTLIKHGTGTLTLSDTACSLAGLTIDAAASCWAAAPRWAGEAPSRSPPRSAMCWNSGGGTSLTRVARRRAPRVKCPGAGLGPLFAAQAREERAR